MKDNVDRSRGLLFSSQVLLALVEKGLDREHAYRHVQRLSHDLGSREHLLDKLLKDKELKKILRPAEARKIFQGSQNQKNIDEILQRVLT